MRQFDNYIESLQKLIKINSVESPRVDNMPFGSGVYEALSYTLSIAEDLGFRTYNGDGYYGYAEIGEGEEMLGILGHLDTVPIGNDWTVPALSGDIINGELCGRGVLDDKGPILATLYAVAELYKSGYAPKMRVRIIFGCDEESGWECIDKYVENEEIPTIAFSPDGDFPVINTEKGVAYYSVSINKPQIIKSIKGGNRPNMVMDYVECELNDYEVLEKLEKNISDIEIVDSKIIMRGISAHGSTPQKGENALLKLFNILSIYSEEIASLLRIIDNTNGEGYGIKCEDEISGKLTINIGTISSDKDKMTFSLDIRYPLCTNRDSIYSTLSKTFGHNKVEAGFYHEPLHISKDHTLVKTLLDSYCEVTGDRLEPIAIGGATYARALPTAVAFGPIFPGQESTIHQKNERAKLTDLEKMYDIYLVAIKKLAFS